MSICDHYSKVISISPCDEELKKKTVTSVQMKKQGDGLHLYFQGKNNGTLYKIPVGLNFGKFSRTKYGKQLKLQTR